MRPSSVVDNRANSVISLQQLPLTGRSTSNLSSFNVEVGNSGLPLKQEQDVLISVEKRLLDCQIEWTDRLGKSSEKMREANREAKKALLDLENEKEKAARLTNEIEELKLEVDTLKMTFSAREKHFQKDVEDIRAKLRKKENEVNEIRMNSTNDMSELGEKCKNLMSTLEEKQNLISQLTELLKKERDGKTNAENLLDVEKGERGKAEKLVRDLEQRVEELSQKEPQMKTKCKQLEEELADLKLECNRKQNMVSELEEAVLAAKRAGAEVAMCSGERDRALSQLLAENSKLQNRLEEQVSKMSKALEKLQEAHQLVTEREQQLKDLNREVETQREYCRSLKLDLERSEQQREEAFYENQVLHKQLIEFKALPICQQQLPGVGNTDFHSLKLVLPFVREKLEAYEKLVTDLNLAKQEINLLQSEKKDLMRAHKDKEHMVTECRVSLEGAMLELERLRGAILEADRKQEAATMRAARLTEQLHREQSDHEKTLQLLKSTENEMGSTEQKFQKVLQRLFQTLMQSQPRSIPGPNVSGLRYIQLVPLVQKEITGLQAALSKAVEKSYDCEQELASTKNQLKSRENELQQLRIDSDLRFSDIRQQLEQERSSWLEKFENIEQKLRNESKTLETKLHDVIRDRDELRNQMIRVDSTKMEMETRLSQTLASLDVSRNENRLLTAACGVLLSSLINSLRRISYLVTMNVLMKTQVSAAESFRNQLQNLLQSLAVTTGLQHEVEQISQPKITGIFRFRKVVIGIIAANRLWKFADFNKMRRTLVVLPAGSCRQIGYSVGLDMAVMDENTPVSEHLSFVYWLGVEDFSKKFIALGSLLSLPHEVTGHSGDDRLHSALRSSLRCVLTTATECFDPQFCPPVNRPHTGLYRESLVLMLAGGLRHCIARRRNLHRQHESDAEAPPIYSFQTIFDSICCYWQKLTDQLVEGWQQQRTRLQSDLTDAQRQLAIFKPDVESLKKQLNMSVPKIELETACGELSSALDREKRLQAAVSDAQRQVQRLMDENQQFVSQHSVNVASLAAKNADLAQMENRVTELVKANDQLQSVASDAEQLVSKAAADRRWACDYVKQVC